MRSSALTVDQYLAELPDDRREAMAAVRQVVLQNLPDGYSEAMAWGMIAYVVPLAVFPDTYNGEPLMYAALASQKNHMAVYLTGIYQSAEERQEFERKYAATGKRLDAGKSCVRFKRIDDLPLALIGETVGSLSVSDFVARAERARAGRTPGRRRPPS